jgi:hypothetical protein
MKKTSILFLLLTQLLFSQKEKLIIGKLVAKENVPQNVHIINLVNEKETISNEKGEFNILAKENDLLVFSSNNFNYERKIIEAKDYKNGAITVQLTEKIEQLDEVKINTNSEINAVSLGILSKPAKKYTPAERKLYTASQGTDGFINTLTGRKKMLKRAAVFEKNQILLSKIDRWFDANFFIQDLKITEENVSRFKFFAVEHPKYQAKLAVNDKNLVRFALIELAAEFNKLQVQRK